MSSMTTVPNVALAIYYPRQEQCVTVARYKRMQEKLTRHASTCIHSATRSTSIWNDNRTCRRTCPVMASCMLSKFGRGR